MHVYRFSTFLKWSPIKYTATVQRWQIRDTNWQCGQESVCVCGVGCVPCVMVNKRSLSWGRVASTQVLPNACHGVNTHFHLVRKGPVLEVLFGHMTKDVSTRDKAGYLFRLWVLIPQL